MRFHIPQNNDKATPQGVAFFISTHFQHSPFLNFLVRTVTARKKQKRLQLQSAINTQIPQPAKAD